MAKAVIDWSKLSAEEVFSVVKDSPRVASIWQYSDITRGYSRHLLWDPRKGCEVTWLTVASVWSSGDRKSWYASYAYDGNEYQREALGPFADRFAAAEAMDAFLEKEGWKVCK